MSETIAELLSAKKTAENNAFANALFRTGDEGTALLDDVASYMTQNNMYRPLEDTGRQVALSTGRSISPLYEQIARILMER
jgi:hypothetical protein